MKLLKLYLMVLSFLCLPLSAIAVKTKMPPGFEEAIQKAHTSGLFEKDEAKRIVTWCFWATGFNRDHSTFSDDQLPTVQIGGPIDAPHFFHGVETYLKHLPPQYAFGLMLDRPTQITNKTELESFKQNFGERFFVADVEDVGRKLIENFPQHEQTLQLIVDNAVGGSPILTSDIFRLIAMPFADPQNIAWDGEEKIRYAYLDVDTFLSSVQRDAEDLVDWFATDYRKEDSNITIGGLVPKLGVVVCSCPEDSCSRLKPYVEVKNFCMKNNCISILNALLKIDVVPSRGKNVFLSYVDRILNAQNVLLLSEIPIFYNSLLTYPSNQFSFSFDYLKDFIRFKDAVITDTGPIFFKKFIYAEKTFEETPSYFFQKLAEDNYQVFANSWLVSNTEKDSKEPFFVRYVKKFWGGKGIPGVEKFIASLQKSEQNEGEQASASSGNVDCDASPSV